MRTSMGLRAKTGRAIAVILREDESFVWRGEVSLVDPRSRAEEGPYHQLLDMPWSEALIAIQKPTKAIERVATNAIAELAVRYDVQCVGIVGAPDRKLEKIGNPHIRAHAAEGVLYRHVLETGARVNGLPYTTLNEKELGQFYLDAMTKRLGKKAGPPWRADERAAATAAWMALQN